MIAGYTRGKSSDRPAGTNVPCLEEERVLLPGQCSHHLAMPPAGVRHHDRHAAAAGLCVLLLKLYWMFSAIVGLLPPELPSSAL
jgi:hypothetical protein